MQSELKILKTKLKEFIRKYYKNQIVKGLLIGAAMLLFLFLTADLIEYYLWSDRLTRTMIFYTFLALSLLVIIRLVLLPLIKLFRLGKSLTNMEAAKIIGDHFPEVSDKLLNTLQLEEDLDEQAADYELLMAGIRQKAEGLTPIPFKNAINLKENIKYVKYLVPFIGIILLILLIAPSFITEPTKRIINHKLEFEKPLPYSIVVLNDSLTALQHDDFPLKIKVEGDELPKHIKLLQGDIAYRIPEIEPGYFEYVFRDLESDRYFKLSTEEYTSKQYHIKVYPKPVIYNVTVSMRFPGYLKKQNEVIENAGDLIVPEGTELNWRIFTKDTRDIVFKDGDETRVLSRKDGNVFKADKKVTKEFNYTIYGRNENVMISDSLSFFVEIIRDEYPEISIEEFTEEDNTTYAHYNGVIIDDHGFNELIFYFRKSAEDSEWQKQIINIDKDLNKQFFQHTVLASDYDLVPGESISYYFEVRDNDAINGYKARRSKTFMLSFPTSEEIAERLNENSDAFKKELEEAKRELESLVDQIEEMHNSLFEKKELNWQDKQKLEEMLAKEEAVFEKFEEMIQLREEMKNMEEMLDNEMDPELSKKMEQLEKLMNELLDEELEKELDEMRKQLEQLDKNKLNELLEQMKLNNEDLKNNIDQNLELYKQLEIEQKMDEAINQLEKLAEKQLEQAEKSAEKQKKKEEAIDEQQKINEEFKDIGESLEDIKELNDQLNEPLNMEVDTAQINGIKSDMDKAASDLNKGRQKKASESQQSAGEKMEQMANTLSLMMENALMEQLGEDAEQVKKMLDNLLDLSFEQEELLNDFEEVSLNDPLYMDYADKQKLLQDDFKVVNDSLMALSKRQVFIQPFIIKEAGKITSYMEKSLTSMQERKKGRTLGEQQYVMTSMNNLALMLEESLQQMNQSLSMMSGKPGKGKCNKPGPGNNPDLGDLLQMQQGLNEGMGKRGNKKEGEGEDGLSSEQLARMAAMQAEIRQRLQDYINELEAEGGNGSSLNKLAEDMEKVEEDLINKRLTQETIQRQKDLEVRLLKAKDAELKREKENKRESREGKSKKSSNQIEKLKYKEIVITQEEILKSVPIEMSPYYKELFKKYLYKLERENGSQ